MSSLVRVRRSADIPREKAAETSNKILPYCDAVALLAAAAAAAAIVVTVVEVRDCA